MRTKTTTKDIRTKAMALAAAISTMMSTAPSAYSCAPEFETAVLINGKHPDMPLKYYAGGNLGIIQPSWAQSYLIVAYRYLTETPLDVSEQESIVQLWHERLQKMRLFDSNTGEPDPILLYFRLRASVLGQKFKSDSQIWDFEYGDISNTGFANACKNFQLLIKKFGIKSTQVKDWLTTQDSIFGVKERKAKNTKDIAAAKKNFAPSQTEDPLLKMQRLYQSAAAKFYENDMTNAKQLFEQLAKQGGPYWQDLAWYMAARSVVTAAVDSADSSFAKESTDYVNRIISRSKGSKYINDLFDLQRISIFRVTPPAEQVELLIKSIIKPHNEHFGSDMKVLTPILDLSLPNYMGVAPAVEAEKSTGENNTSKLNDPRKYDLTDWLANIQDPDQSYWGEDEIKKWNSDQKVKAAYALERWRKTHTLPWLVAALSHNNLLSTQNTDLLNAANKIEKSSPAFVTARFYLIDALLHSKQTSKANSLVKETLLMKNLAPSARNLFMLQSLACAKSADEYTKNIVQPSVATVFTQDEAELPQKWLLIERGKNYQTSNTVIASSPSDDLNVNLPQSKWLAWASNKALPKSVHTGITRAAWVRSKLLGTDSAYLDIELGNSYPEMRSGLEKYRAITNEVERKFALACLILKYEGMSPYLHGGIERHNDKINELDGYNYNFWLPYPLSNPAQNPQNDEGYAPWRESTRFSGSKRMNELISYYSRPVLRQVLSKEELIQVDAERKAILTNHPSKFLGDPILAWAKSHPGDARVPEALYRVVKLPKWSQASKVGTEYSRAAYVFLHKQFPKNKWTQKAVCWY